MKTIKILAIITLIMIFGCSNEELYNSDPDTLKNEETNKEDLINGLLRETTVISFTSYSLDGNNVPCEFYEDWFKLPQSGYFSGKIVGYGKINSSLSTYQFEETCELIESPNPKEWDVPYFYGVKASGTLALSPNDRCTITFTGILYPTYPNYITDFNGEAITSEGVGKLKGLDGMRFKFFNYYSRKREHSINLEEGTISLKFSNSKLYL